MEATQFGVLDNRFLARSLGLLNPPTPLLVQETASIKTALLLLKEHRIGSVVVTNAEGKLRGIFTERDVVLKICESGLNLEKTPIAEVMTAEPHSAQMTTTIAFALTMMSQGGFRHIPIVDDENIPVGIISVKDIVDYLVHSVNKDLMSFGEE